LEGIRGEESIAYLCRQEGMLNNLYYPCSKYFLEVVKKRLMGDTTSESNFSEISVLKKENEHLK
jgi:transposase